MIMLKTVNQKPLASTAPATHISNSANLTTCIICLSPLGTLGNPQDSLGTKPSIYFQLAKCRLLAM